MVSLFPAGKREQARRPLDLLLLFPLVLFYIFAQRFIIEGLTSGAVKG